MIVVLVRHHNCRQCARINIMLPQMVLKRARSQTRVDQHRAARRLY